MKTNSTKNWMKVAGLTLAIGTFAFTANAQNTTTAVANLGVVKNSDVAGTAVKANGTIRLIDNKGTIKYLQVQNGITAITNTSDDKTGVTTTWQLGGTLTDDTYIDANGKVFGIKGIPADAYVADATVTPKKIGAAAAFDGTGWTIVVRDEATGQFKKVLASDLLQVQAGEYAKKVTDATAVDFTPTAGGLPTSISKIYVYRNGAKLVGDVITPANSDYTTDGTKVTLNPSNTTYGEWALYVGDVVEIHWIK